MLILWIEKRYNLDIPTHSKDPELLALVQDKVPKKIRCIKSGLCDGFGPRKEPRPSLSHRHVVNWTSVSLTTIETRGEFSSKYTVGHKDVTEVA